jgi:hypothetical protein
MREQRQVAGQERRGDDAAGGADRRQGPRQPPGRPRVGHHAHEPQQIVVGQIAELAHHRAVDPGDAGGRRPRQQRRHVGEPDDRPRVRRERRRIDQREHPRDAVPAARAHDAAHVRIAQQSGQLVGAARIVAGEESSTGFDARGHLDPEVPAEPREPVGEARGVDRTRRSTHPYQIALAQRGRADHVDRRDAHHVGRKRG